MASDARCLVLVVTDNEVILVLHVLAVNLNLWHDAVTCIGLIVIVIVIVIYYFRITQNTRYKVI
jgi:hypothetical protein